MKLAKKTFNGISLYCRENTTDEQAAHEVIVKNCYLGKMMSVDKDDVWLDAGANIGSFSVMVASMGAKSIAIEPHPENIGMVKKNIELAKVAARVKVIQAAIGMRDGQGQLFICNGDRNKYRHTMRPIRGRNSIPVKIIGIQGITGFNCIKMDIEGSEFEILEEYSFRGVKKIALEYHFDRDRSIARFERIRKRLELLGFETNNRKMPNSPTYDWFPAMTILKCKRKA